MIQNFFLIHRKILLLMNILKIALSTHAKKAINAISSKSNVPGMPSNICEISRDNAIIVKTQKYIAPHLRLVSQTARITNNPDKNHRPSGKL
jgi:hypothetical protein